MDSDVASSRDDMQPSFRRVSGDIKFSLRVSWHGRSTTQRVEVLIPMQRFDRLRRVGDGRTGVPRGMNMQVPVEGWGGWDIRSLHPGSETILRAQTD
jgi:hypothetical protein